MLQRKPRAATPALSPYAIPTRGSKAGPFAKYPIRPQSSCARQASKLPCTSICVAPMSSTPQLTALRTLGLFVATMCSVSSCKSLDEDIRIVPRDDSSRSNSTTDATQSSLGTQTTSPESTSSASSSPLSTSAPETAQSTGSSITSSTSTTTSTSTGTSTSGGTLDDPTDEVPKDETGTLPKGSSNAPTRGTKFSLDFVGPIRAESETLRLMIAQVALSPASSGEDLKPGVIGPRLSFVSVAADYPVDTGPLLEGNPIVVTLPIPPTTRIDPELKRSPLYMVALYEEPPGAENQRWDPSDLSKGATADLLFYEPAGPEHQARWSRWLDYGDIDALLTQAADTLELDPEKLQRLETSLPMTQFEYALPAELSGPFEDLDPGASFVTAMTMPEIQDLPKHFEPGARSLDLALRQPTNQAAIWKIDSAQLPGDGPKAGGWSTLEAPGIRSEFFSTKTLVTYRRPIGAPLPAPGQYLSANSQLISGLCPQSSQGYTVLRWLDAANTESWITRPVGLFYAAALGLRPGWTWGVVQDPSLAKVSAVLASPTQLSSIAGQPNRCPLPASSWRAGPPQQTPASNTSSVLRAYFPKQPS